MATRAIVTSQPVVACDVCGRRLLRGETPDVFLAGGQRRTVCELCVPRAAAGGWLREADRHELSVRPARPRRAGSLLGRLRQLREPEKRSSHRDTSTARRRTALGEEARGLYDDHDELYDFLDGGVSEHLQPDGSTVFIGAVQAEHPDPGADSGEGEVDLPGEADLPAAPGSAGTVELAAERALEVFNAGETPQRVAGVSRSLGAPTVVVRPADESGTRMAIVVAWELCWYRYEVDLDDEAPGVQLAAEGMELDELPEHDRVPNAAADERGRLAPIGA